MKQRIINLLESLDMFVFMLMTLGGAPTVRMDEETVLATDGESFIKPVPGMSFPFDPALVIQLRNPQTGDLIPGATMTGMEVYVALHSLYLQKALERDAALVGAGN